MALVVEMGGGVLADGIVAAPDVPALLAHPEVDPTHPGGEAFHAPGPARLAPRRWSRDGYMSARILHDARNLGRSAVTDGPPDAESATPARTNRQITPIPGAWRSQNRRVGADALLPFARSSVILQERADVRHCE